MEDSNAIRIMRRHLVITRRIRALDHRKGSVEFAEGRLWDYRDRIRELIALQTMADEPIDGLQKLITVSLQILALKRKQFNLPVVQTGDKPENDFDEPGLGVPCPIPFGPFSLQGSGGRTFKESAEWNDWG
jgi:hypothetical protein